MTSPLPGQRAQLIIEYAMQCPEHGETHGFPTEGSARFAVDEHNRRHHATHQTDPKETTMTTVNIPSGSIAVHPDELSRLRQGDKILAHLEEHANTAGVRFQGGPDGAWLSVDGVLDILGERGVS